MAKPKAVGYVRVSTEAQVDGDSLDAQRAQIRQWAKTHGFTLVAIYEDAGISGSNGLDTRQGLYDALDAITSGRASTLVVKNLDRLARALHVQEGVLAQVWTADARTWSIEDGGEVLEDDPDDPMRTAMRQMRGVFSQLERGMINKRMRDGRARKRAADGYVGGRPKYGERAEDGRLVEDETERQVVDLVRSMRSQSEPASYRAIADELEQRRLKPRKGERFHPTQVMRIARRAGVS